MRVASVPRTVSTLLGPSSTFTLMFGWDFSNCWMRLAMTGVLFTGIVKKVRLTVPPDLPAAVVLPPVARPPDEPPPQPARRRATAVRTEEMRAIRRRPDRGHVGT